MNKKLNLLSQCIEAFINRGAFKGASIESNGEKLFSYGWFVIAQWIAGEVVLRKGGVPSVTTIRQMKQLEDMLINANIPYRRSTEESDHDQAEMRAERPPSLQGLKPHFYGRFQYFRANATWEEWIVQWRFKNDPQAVTTIADRMTEQEAQALCAKLNASIEAVTKGE